MTTIDTPLEEQKTSDSANDQIYDHTIIKKIAFGNFGKVFLVRHEPTDEWRALKIIQKPVNESRGNKAQFIKRHKTEIDILNKLDHPNICKAYADYEDETTFFIFTELAKDGDLQQFLCSQKVIPEDLA